MESVVKAISVFYEEKGMAEFYKELARLKEGDEREALLLKAKNHSATQASTYDYIVANFREDIVRQSATVKEHFAGMF